MKKWTQKEINFLKENYEKNSNKELVRILDRTYESIGYMAFKLHLKKSYDILCKSKRKLNKELTKDIFKNLYHQEKKSIREIAKILGIGKNTADYYLKKYKIKKRDKSHSAKIGALKCINWRKGLDKKDPKILAAAEKSKLTNAIKRKERLIKIEEKFGKPMKNLINDLYWGENLNQESIARKIGISRGKVISLMKQFDISKRPNYEYIANLKGVNHPQYGKKWEDLYGKAVADKMRKQMSLRARRNIIKRLKNQEMPFINTKIEKKIAAELTNKGIIFSQQYSIDKKFVCDFAILGFNIIIECDGDYWHANPKFYDRNNLDRRQKMNWNRDKFKDIYLAKKGWKVFRFFEYDINKSPEKCVERIIQEIKHQLKSIKNPLKIP